MMTVNQQDYTLPALEMIDIAANTLVASSAAIDLTAQDQIFFHIRRASDKAASRDELVSHFMTQAYESVGFGPVLEALSRHAN